MKNLNFNAFINRITYFEHIRKYAEPITLDLDIIELPYWTVKNDIPEKLKSGDYNTALKLAFSDKISKFDNYKKTRLLVHLLNEYEAINQMEEKNLKSELSDDKKSAGFERLNALGVTGVIFNLCDNDLTKFEEVKMKQYKLVFSLQLKKYIVHDSNQKLRAIRKENDRVRRSNSK